MLIFYAILTIFLLGVFFFDLTRYIIPNWMCGVFLALYPVFLLSTPMPADFVWWHSVLIMIAVFGLGFVIFILGLAGGGDVKLLTVLSLWTGTKSTLIFLMYMGLLGGVLAVILLAARALVIFLMSPEKAAKIPRILQDKAPLPYGLAISVAFLILLWSGEMPGLPLKWQSVLAF